MKWWLLGGVVLLFLPFYIFILSKSITLGKIDAMKYLGEIILPKHKHEEGLTNGKEEK